jgi:hypothetical protein
MQTPAPAVALKLPQLPRKFSLSFILLYIHHFLCDIVQVEKSQSCTAIICPFRPIHVDR